MTLHNFSAATLSAGDDPWIEATTGSGESTSYQTSSFYQDSSGKTTLDLPLRMTFPDAESLTALLTTKCIYPPPISSGQEEEKDESDAKERDKNTEPATQEEEGDKAQEDETDRYSFGVEAKVTMTTGSGEAVSASVESVHILHTARPQDNILALETQLVLRVSRQEDDGKLDNRSLHGVRLNLEISAVLSEKSQVEDRDAAASVGLRALYLGRYADLAKTSARRVVHNRLNPIQLQATLSHAFFVTARSLSGPSIGETLVSLVIKHSNTHQQDVVVSNLALHPAFSRSTKTGSQSDQSGSIQWGFAPGAQLQMPMIIHPQQAHATILHILGFNETGQTYVSPLSVTASIQAQSSDPNKGRAKSVVAAVEVEWESASQVPNNSMDALRVDVTVDEECKVGDPFTVKLRVQNLGQRPVSNLKVMLPESIRMETQQFRILGMGDQSEENSREIRNDLLEVDEVLPLAEIRSRESTEAEVRFIALHEGTLRIPNFEIRDVNSNRCFRCTHNVQVVVVS